MIDTKELRRKLRSDDLMDHVDIHANVKPVLTELINRLEAAEKSDAESLMMYRKARGERDELRAKIVEMERQEPLHLFRRRGLDDFCTCSKERYEAFSANPRLFEVKMLYTLSGAKGETK